MGSNVGGKIAAALVTPIIFPAVFIYEVMDHFIFRKRKEATRKEPSLKEPAAKELFEADEASNIANRQTTDKRNELLHELHQLKQMLDTGLTEKNGIIRRR